MLFHGITIRVLNTPDMLEEHARRIGRLDQDVRSWSDPFRGRYRAEAEGAIATAFHKPRPVCATDDGGVTGLMNRQVVGDPVSAGGRKTPPLEPHMQGAGLFPKVERQFFSIPTLCCRCVWWIVLIYYLLWHMFK